MPSETPRLSVVTPAYNEAENLPSLYARLSATFSATGMACEWIVVDDHSIDATFAVVAALARTDARVHGVRLSRRCGSHAAILCGILEGAADAVAFLAADMQDPPELLMSLLAEWRGGVPLVWAVRRTGDAQGYAASRWSQFYYRLLRRVAGNRNLPKQGVGCFLIDGQVVERLRRDGRSAVDVVALIGSLGFPFAIVEYDRAPRLHGESGWTFWRKLTFALASLVSLSPLVALRAPAECPIEARIGGPESAASVGLTQHRAGV